MRIALDAMGGDFAPDAIIQGAIMASHDLPEDAESLLKGGGRCRGNQQQQHSKAGAQAHPAAFPNRIRRTHFCKHV